MVKRVIKEILAQRVQLVLLVPPDPQVQRVIKEILVPLAQLDQRVIKVILVQRVPKAFLVLSVLPVLQACPTAAAFNISIHLLLPILAVVNMTSRSSILFPTLFISWSMDLTLLAFPVNCM